MELNYMVTGFLGIYFLSLLLTGLFAYRNMGSLEDFLLAGRQLKPLTLALTVSSTGMSGWLALGFAAYSYENGFQSLWIMVPSATIGILLCYIFVGKKIRVYSEKVGAITITEIIKKRFYDETNFLNITTVIIICTAAIAYVSGQLIATGKILYILFGWNYQVAIIAAALMMMIYSTLGGFYAVCWTDFIQGILMIIGSFMAGGLVIVYAGGFQEISFRLAEVNKIYPEFAITPFASVSVIIMGISMFIGDGIFNWLGQPTLMMRYMAAKSSKTLNMAAIITITIQLILFSGVFLASVYMRTQFPNPSLLPYSGDTETVLIQFFFVIAHPVFVGIFIAAIMASIMSTADSLLMMATSVLVNDVYSYFKPKASQKHLIFISRITTITLGVISILISLNNYSVLWSSWFGWTTLGITGIPLIVGLYWEKATKEGAIAGIISGFSILVLWNLFNLTYRFNTFQALPACGGAFLLTIIVSRFTQSPPAHVQEDIRDLKKYGDRNQKEVEIR